MKIKYVSLLALSLVVLLGAGCNRAATIPAPAPADQTPSTPPPAAQKAIPSAAPAADLPTPAANAPKPQTVSIEISNFSFQPQILTVAPGTTVVWTNRDGAPHTATAQDRSFDSGTLNTNGTFSRTFTTAGTFSYFCSIHPSMQAKIVVQ
ncbi:MAG: cupredoxin family copper-binding protein [Candidatus Magasanikbacteria bacterium]|nr:cupredoxin family copper-binding protein [Candidatus Magasanikbacteria bacterium]